MKLSLPLFTLTCILQSSNAINNSTRNLKSKSWEYSKSKGNLKSKKSGKSSKSKGPSGTITVPEIGSLIDKAFPMWEVDEDGNRVEDKPCNIDSFLRMESILHYQTLRWA